MSEKRIVQPIDQATAEKAGEELLAILDPGRAFGLERPSSVGPVIGMDKIVRQWVEDSGIAAGNWTRVIIDIPVDDVVKVYIEQYGEAGMFKIEPPSLSDAKITVAESPDADEVANLREHNAELRLRVKRLEQRGWTRDIGKDTHVPS